MSYRRIVPSADRAGNDPADPDLAIAHRISSMRARLRARTGAHPHQPRRLAPRGQRPGLARRGRHNRNYSGRRRTETGSHASAHTTRYHHSPGHAQRPPHRRSIQLRRIEHHLQSKAVPAPSTSSTINEDPPAPRGVCDVAHRAFRRSPRYACWGYRHLPYDTLEHEAHT